MSKKIRVKLIMRLAESGMSQNAIARLHHISKRSISDVLGIAKENGIEPTLPVVSEGDEIEYLEGSISDKTTKAPSWFTPATLLKAMKEIHKFVRDANLRAELKECSGIGTEATRAGIIEELQNSGFLSLSKKYL